jgi:hypothetical protein
MSNAEATDRKEPKNNKRKQTAIESTSKDNQTWTFTFSESVENHAGMQQIGTKAKEGFLYDDLKAIEILAQNAHIKTEMIDLNFVDTKNPEYSPHAHILILRDGWTMFLTDNEKATFKHETETSEVDKLVWMRGAVKKKHARWNLCYAKEGQDADYKQKKGTIVAFDKVPMLNKVRSGIESFGSKAKNLNAEMNYYYDLNQCGIGFHGDTERRLVIGLRLGSTMNLTYQWFQNFVPLVSKSEKSASTTLSLSEGDIYIMGDKAVGWDWKHSKLATLRHAAGCKKYTTWKPKTKVSSNKKQKVSK